jgi:hypothetical protein
MVGPAVAVLASFCLPRLTIGGRCNNESAELKRPEGAATSLAGELGAAKGRELADQLRSDMPSNARAGPHQFAASHAILTVQLSHGRINTVSRIETRNKRSILAFAMWAIWRTKMRKSLFAAAMIMVIATPVMADEVGVRAGPVGAGVTVGEPRDHDRDRERTVIKEREPLDSKTVIKKEDADGDRSKTVIHHDN